MSYAPKSYATHTRKTAGGIKPGKPSPSEVLEDGIFRATSVICTVRMTDQDIFIYAKSYADYLLAKATIRHRVTKPIHFEVLP